MVKRVFTLSPAMITVAIYLLLALAWIFGADVLVEMGVTLDLFDEPSGGVIREIKLASLLAGTCLFIYCALRGHQRTAGTAAQRLRLVGDAAANGIAVVDDFGVVQVTNAAFRRLLDLSPLVEGASPIETLIGPYVTDHGGWTLPAEGEMQHALRMRSGSGEETEVTLRTRRFDDGGSASGWILTAQDLTADRNETMTRAVRLRALETATDGIAVANLEQPDAPLIYVNRAFQEITGYSDVEMLGRNCRHLQGHERHQPEIEMVREAIRHSKPVTVTMRNYRKDGTMFWNEMRLTPVFGDRGTVTHYVSIMRDVTQERENARKLERLTCYDAETSLYNRFYFAERLSEMLASASLSVLLVKLDIIGFNEIVGCFGEESGSQLLREIGRRLSDVAPDGIVGMLNGNEFGVAVPVGDEATAEALILELRAAISAEYSLAASSLRVFFSIGTAMGARGSGAAALMRQALIALIQSKRTRIGAPRGFRAGSEDDVKRRVRLTSDLQQAVADGDFKLHYQPRVHIETGEIIGAEALIRWYHPVFGLQPPGRFIPAAEQTSHIIAIGSWALHEAAGFAARVNSRRVRPLSFSVNVSAIQFQHDDIVGVLRAAVRDTGADPAWLTLEITEAVFAGDTPEAMQKLRLLREAGFGISIDDFGTGYSNLQYLCEFPLTEIKIDHSFVRGIGESSFKQTIVGSVVRIGESLGVNVVAEGIETDAERRNLADLGVEQGYGYLFSLPLEPDAFMRLVEGNPLLPTDADYTRAVEAA